MNVVKDGFNSYVQTGIILQVDSNPVIDVTLQVGSVSQEIAVQADATMVETHSTGVGQVVDQQRVVDLPLNGREATQLIYLAGAATTAPTADLNSSKNYPTVVISVAGGLSNGMTYLLDGGTHNDPFNNLNLPLPFPDALQEFKVETSALPAQYGHHSAAAVNAVTKSGSNEFHGVLFEFLRNGDLNARNFFALSRDTLRRNQYGGAVGGPIKKNKLFFFAGYQGTVQRSDPTTGVGYVPTTAMLTGNFSAIASPACNGGRQITLKAPFTNNQISPSLFSVPAVNLVNRLPQTSNPCGLVRYGSVTDSTENLGIVKVDYQISPKHTIFARYYAAHFEQPSPYNNNDPLTVTTAAASDNVQSFVIGDTYLIGAGTISSFHATFNRAAVHKGSPPFFSEADLGVDMAALVPGFSLISVTGAFTVGANIAAPGHVVTNTPQLSEDINLVRGSHQIAIGANWIKPQENALINLATFGNFNFNGQFTGLSMGDFLLGDVNTFTQGNSAQAYQRGDYIGLYVQDSWRVSSRFTLNAGVRWEPFFPVSTKYGFVSHFDDQMFVANQHSTVYPQAPAGLTFPGDPGYPGNAGYFGKTGDFAPRLGVVWDPKGDGRLTVRSSYGIFYDLPALFFDYAFATEPPYGDLITLTSPAGGFAQPWANYPGGNPFPTKLGGGAIFPTAAAYLNFPLHTQPTYLEQWNLSIQKQIGSNWLVTANYLGNDTVHLWTSLQANSAIYIPGNSSTSNTNQRRVLYLENPSQGQYFSTIAQVDDGGTASYNGLLLSLQRRLSKGVTVLANYTWSHCITDLGTTELSTSPNYSIATDRRADRGNCALSDIRHLFNLSAVAQSPTFTGHIERILLSNWQVSAIVSAHSGTAFNVTTGVDNALTGQSNERPNLIGNPIPAVQSVSQWVNPAAFATPASGVNGNLGINVFSGPSLVDLDTALVRIFHISETKRAELRGEAFNLLNHANFLNPTATLSSGSFGKILTANDPRIMQVAVKLYF